MTTVQTPYRIEWRPKAREDLRAIVRYIAKDNPLRARTFGLELRNKTLPLADHPSLGRPGRPGLPAGVRELVVHRNYIVFYRALDAAGLVDRDDLLLLARNSFLGPFLGDAEVTAHLAALDAVAAGLAK